MIKKLLLKKKYVFISLKTKFLKKNQIASICKLKNSVWPWSLLKQIKWFKKNVKENDINNMMILNNQIIGYTLLRKRKSYINNKSLIYYYFDTFVVEKKYRKMGFGKALILFNLKILRKLKKHSFLTCTTEHVSFYRKYNWKILPYAMFKIMDHKHFWFKNLLSVRGMTFNLKRKVNKKILYYFN